MTQLKYIMKKNLFSVSPNSTVREASNLMKEKNNGLVLVFSNDKLVGLFSERDLLNRVFAKDLDLDQTKVEDVMTKKIITSTEEDNIYLTLKTMKKHNIRHLPILDSDNNCVGIVSIKDIVESLKTLLDEQNNALLEYIICLERVKSVINEV